MAQLADVGDMWRRAYVKAMAVKRGGDMTLSGGAASWRVIISKLARKWRRAAHGGAPYRAE